MQHKPNPQPPIVQSAIIGALLFVLAACQTTGAAKPKDEPMDGVQQTLFQSAREAEMTNKYDLAASAYARLMEHRSQDPEILASLLRNLRYSGYANQGLDYLRTNVDASLLTDPEVRFEKGKALLAAGQHLDALDELAALRNEAPNDWRVHSALGITFDSLERFNEALDSYQAALRLSPNNEVVMNNMAMSYAMVGRLRDGIDLLERAAVVNRSNTQIRQNLALLYAINGNMDRAKALAAMDLDKGELETNLTFYRRFEGSPR
ncbi:tetratricopeptide repeat protein [Magnetovibrio sp. PR-2]|uniref:tetratricopeptide repeat protein n=1 Tax=Magnetovibrio sp. PR-2 TaxID=3120356 RepID=UPI002FCDEEEC